MITVHIDDSKAAGKKILNEIAQNPSVGNIQNSNVKRDANGNLIGVISVDEYFSKLDDKLSQHYGVDFKTL